MPPGRYDFLKAGFERGSVAYCQIWPVTLPTGLRKLRVQKIRFKLRLHRCALWIRLDLLFFKLVTQTHTHMQTADTQYIKTIDCRLGT